jgi:uncharacterized protein
MSQENVELVRRSFELWLCGDVEAWIETVDPDVGWDISTHPLPDVPNHGRGRDALVTDMLATYASGWTDYSFELKELVDAGDNVIAVLHETAKMRDTGVPLDRDLVHLWTVRDGRGALPEGVQDEGRGPRSRRAVGVRRERQSATGAVLCVRVRCFETPCLLSLDRVASAHREMTEGPEMPPESNQAFAAREEAAARTPTPFSVYPDRDGDVYLLTASGELDLATSERSASSSTSAT